MINLIRIKMYRNASTILNYIFEVFYILCNIIIHVPSVGLLSLRASSGVISCLLR